MSYKLIVSLYALIIPQK